MIHLYKTNSDYVKSQSRTRLGRGRGGGGGGGVGGGGVVGWWDGGGVGGGGVVMRTRQYVKVMDDPIRIISPV